MEKIKIPTPTWVELYGELSSYVEEYGSIDCRFDDDGNRLEEYEGEYESIVDDVENIMSRYFVKSEQKGGAEAGFVAQLLFYPVTEQLFVFNDSRYAAFLL